MAAGVGIAATYSALFFYAMRSIMTALTLQQKTAEGYDAVLALHEAREDLKACSCVKGFSTLDSLDRQHPISY
jgi:hypothetical protein